MMFFLSLTLWLVLSPEPEPGNIVLGLSVSLISALIARELLPRGSFLKVFFRIGMAIPAALFQSFCLLFTKEPRFTAWETPCPENRVDEFGKIISITLTPEEIVVLKDQNTLIVHGVKRK